MAGAGQENPPAGETTNEAVEPLTAESITVPEGFEIEDSVRDNFLGIMNNAELSPAQRAQELINLQTSLTKAAHDKAISDWETQQNTWQEEIRNDPEIGGQHLEATTASIGRLLTQYPVEGVREAFDSTGAGNNPAIVKWLTKIAKDLGEGEPTTGDTPTKPLSQAERLYGSNK